jgi:hypothetical protein
MRELLSSLVWSVLAQAPDAVPVWTIVDRLRSPYCAIDP